MNVDSYLDQHKEAVGLVLDLESKLLNPAEEAEAINGILTTLIGKLTFHISMEDKFIYPKALESANEDLKTMAGKMQSEMGTIGGVLDSYAKNWAAVAQIKADPDTFVTETKKIISALKGRIAAEEKNFYPLVAEHA